jgi:hypothetical protein
MVSASNVDVRARFLPLTPAALFKIELSLQPLHRIDLNVDGLVVRVKLNGDGHPHHSLHTLVIES